MDTIAPEMVDFIVIPVETIVVCNFILSSVKEAIRRSGSHVAGELDSLFNYGHNILQSTQSWPLVVVEHSQIHEAIYELQETADKWLQGALLLKESREKLGQFLECPFAFSASGLKTHEDGTLFNREWILLKQSAGDYYKADHRRQISFMSFYGDHRQRYREFLVDLMWVLDDPLPRMFAPVFKGKYQARTGETEHGETLEELESLNIEDDAFTVAMHTPSTTRTTSPALTERPDNATAHKTVESKPIKAPTLKYIAVIETETDKAIFNLDISDVNDKKRKVMMSAKEMCTEMVSKGYGDKVKLQDIMDMAIKMAKK